VLDYSVNLSQKLGPHKRAGHLAFWIRVAGASATGEYKMAHSSAWTARSVTLFGALLLSTAFIAPAFADIEVVVVTAEKRSQNVQTIPIAISVFTSEKRDAIGITTVQDMTNFTPGLAYQTSLDRVFLRGVGRQTNSQAADTPVANYDDGLFETFADAA
jgi:outer membrane receptor protein involved in Fe transport